MKKILVIITTLIAFNSYAGCEKYSDYVDITSEVLTKVLNCKNYEVLRKDISSLGHRMGFCKESFSEGILCLVIGKVSVAVVEKQIPLTWECDPTTAMRGLEKIVVKTCEKIISL